MDRKIIENALELYKLDYDKVIGIALQLQQTKLSYQKLFITVISTIGTVSIAFLKTDFLKSNSELSIESLIGLLLLFASLIGYVLIRSLVSNRRQAIFYNNALIYLRSELIENYRLSDKFPKLKEVEGNHKDSADYITIVFYSIINGLILLLFDLSNLTPLPLAVSIAGIAGAYFISYYLTIEKLLTNTL